MSETRGPEKSKKADDSDDASVTDRIQNMKEATISSSPLLIL